MYLPHMLRQLSFSEGVTLNRFVDSSPNCFRDRILLGEGLGCGGLVRAALAPAMLHRFSRNCVSHRETGLYTAHVAHRTLRTGLESEERAQ